MIERTVAPTDRIVGLDVARGLAIVGMILVNFKVVMGAEDGDPRWLRTLAAALDGRAAATFLVLAGIGASLGSRRVRADDDPPPPARRTARITLARRGAFLFVVGWLFVAIWPADILHFYGVYLVVGAVMLFAPDRRLLGLAVAAMTLSFVFVASFDYFANWDLEGIAYEGIATPAGSVRSLFFDGFHPVFPWIAFYLFGMWLGRTDLHDREWRRTLAVCSAAAVVVTELAAWTVFGPRGSALDDLDEESWRWLFSVEPLPPLPLYVVAGTGTAVLVIVGSIWLSERLSPVWLQPLAATGQLALTLYVAHVIVGMGVLDELGRLEDQSLPFALAASAGFSIAAIAGAWTWRRHFDRGPLEGIMRQVAG